MIRFSQPHGVPSRAVERAVTILTVALLLLAGWRAVPVVEDARGRADRRLLADAADGRPTVLVLFQERDCTVAGQFVTDWRRLTASGDARVVAVPINVRSPEALAEVVAHFPEDLQVRPDLARAGSALLRSFRAPYTPVAVLLDPRGRPRLIIPETEASQNQLVVQAAVSTYLSMRRRQ